MASELLEYRLTVSTDVDGILAVLEEVAPDIPVHLTPKAREIIGSRIGQCCSTEQSCVAVDHAGRVVGFLLGEPDKKERLHHDNQALHLPYSGVTKTWRTQGLPQADGTGNEPKGRPDCYGQTLKPRRDGCSSNEDRFYEDQQQRSGRPIPVATRPVTDSPDDLPLFTARQRVAPSLTRRPGGRVPGVIIIEASESPAR